MFLVRQEKLKSTTIKSNIKKTGKSLGLFYLEYNGFVETPNNPVASYRYVELSLWTIVHFDHLNNYKSILFHWIGSILHKVQSSYSIHYDTVQR